MQEIEDGISSKRAEIFELNTQQQQFQTRRNEFKEAVAINNEMLEKLNREIKALEERKKELNHRKKKTQNFLCFFSHFHGSWYRGGPVSKCYMWAKPKVSVFKNGQFRDPFF